MGGAVMLLMAATVGITYGWAPDGGSGVKYIIQVPPEKVEQVVRSGEISSHIPAEIRGHVSEVVVRIGHGSLPRVTPSFLSVDCVPTAPGSTAVAAADRMPVPIPAMSDPAALRPIGGRVSAPSTMMKPSPQSGGMNLPGFSMPPAPSTSSTSSTGSTGSTGSTNASNNFNQTARDTASRVGNELRGAADAGRQQMQQNLNTATERLGEAAQSQMQSAVDQARDGTAQLFAPRASSSTPDDPRTRLSQNSSTETDRPSSDPYDRSPQQRSGYEQPSQSQDTPTPPPFATSRANPASSSAMQAGESDRNTFNQTAQSGSVSNPTTNTTRDDDWYDLRNGSRRRPSTDPIDAPSDNSGPSSGLSGSGFGRLPGGLQAETSPASSNSSTGSRGQSTGTSSSEPARRDNRMATALDYDPHLTPAQAAQLPKNGYSFDAQNYPVDREGYRLDSYGRRVDRQGRLLTSADSMASVDDERRSSNNGSSSNAYPPSNAYTGNSPQLVQPPLAPPAQQPPLGQQPPTGQQPPLAQQPSPNSPYGNYNQAPYQPSSPSPGLSPTLGAGMPGYNPYSDPRYAGSPGTNVAPRSAEETVRSASDSSTRAKRFDDLDSALAGDARDQTRQVEQVAAQPIFNALLLLSIVANVYLLVWLKNLRLQFRDMVASNRAVNSSTSLAA